MAVSTAFLEREYNARAAIADHPQIFARWAEQGAATRRHRACVLDLAYGQTAAERLDLFPARSDAAPLLVFIHGGYWRSLDKSDFSWLAPAFVPHGVAVALLNYGLAPATPLEDIVRQTLRALAWLYDNGDRLGFDPERIVVAGHSAGAHLTAMAMAAIWPVWQPGLPRDLVKGAVAISGLYDLEPLVRAPFINADLQLDGARARQLSPLHLPPAGTAPLVTAVGALESSEFRRQTDLMATAWSAVLDRNLTIERTNHLTVCDAFGSQDSALFDAALHLARSA